MATIEEYLRRQKGKPKSKVRFEGGEIVSGSRRPTRVVGEGKPIKATPGVPRQDREWQPGDRGGTYEPSQLRNAMNSRKDQRPVASEVRAMKRTPERKAPVNTKDSRKAIESAFVEEEKKRKKEEQFARLRNNLNNPSKKPTVKTRATGKKGAGPVKNG